jgi:pullulanase
MDLLAFGAVITSQGIPFFAEGDDFGRTRHYAENSYDNNDPTVNPINWSLKSKNYDMFKFYQGMIKLRKAHPAFRMYTKEMVDKHLDFIYKTSDSMIAYTIKDNANGDTWKNILVVLNSSPDDQVIELVGQWEIVVLGDKAGTEMIKIDTDKITVPGISILVAHTEDKLFTCQLEP